MLSLLRAVSRQVCGEQSLVAARTSANWPAASLPRLLLLLVTNADRRPRFAGLDAPSEQVGGRRMAHHAAALLPILLLLIACSRLCGASYLLTHTSTRPMVSYSPDLCVIPELELQRMQPANLTQHIRTPLESVRQQLAADTKGGHLQLAASRRSLSAVRGC